MYLIVVLVERSGKNVDKEKCNQVWSGQMFLHCKPFSIISQQCYHRNFLELKRCLKLILHLHVCVFHISIWVFKNVRFFECTAQKDNWGSAMSTKLLPVLRRSLLKPVLLTQVFSKQQSGGYVHQWGSVRTWRQPIRKEKEILFFLPFANCCMIRETDSHIHSSYLVFCLVQSLDGCVSGQPLKSEHIFGLFSLRQITVMSDLNEVRGT